MSHVQLGFVVLLIQVLMALAGVRSDVDDTDRVIGQDAAA